MAQALHHTFVDRLNDAVMTTLLRAGVKLGTASLLTVRGRKSGQPHTVPVLLVEQDGQRWLVAPYGEVQWVRNIRAAGRATLTRGRRSETIAVTELPAWEAAPILKRYLVVQHAADVRSSFAATKDAWCNTLPMCGPPSLPQRTRPSRRLRVRRPVTRSFRSRR